MLLDHFLLHHGYTRHRTYQRDLHPPRTINFPGIMALRIERMWAEETTKLWIWNANTEVQSCICLIQSTKFETCENSPQISYRAPPVLMNIHELALFVLPSL